MPDLKEILKFGNSFCILPFLHEHLDVDHKKKVCCLSKQEINNNRLAEIQNSMLNNEVVPECNTCYDKENNKTFSHRQLFNTEWFNRYPEIVNDVVENPHVYSYDLRYSNLCNLRCQTCDAVSSSTWADYLGETEKYKAWEPNLNINPDTKRIYMAGGEPFLIKSFSTVLNSIKNKDCEVVINTTVTVLTDHMMNALQPFTNICFILSIDGIGEVNDKIRTLSNWNTIVDNIQTLREKLDPSFQVNTVIQKDNLDDVPNIALWLDSQNIKMWNTTLLTHPEQFSYKLYTGKLNWDSLWNRECVKSNIQVQNTLKQIANHWSYSVS